ncbi:MAG: ABC transporter ATP-binding protein [Alphaproteobacteria bacterium]|nr:ABC transporter ATP-binding protein [Alphaproteobacteria bacterium]
MLKIDRLTVRYGKITAVREVSMHVGEGEIVTLIGTNGAGKTTLLRTISGLNKPAEGDILLGGQSISGLAPERINGLGIAHVPEGRRLFPHMSVFDNLELGAFQRNDADGVRRDMDMVMEHFPKLRERREQMAGSLSGGEQQMVAMGRAIMSSPKVVLMDEPSLGLSPIMCQEIAKIIRQIHEMGRTIVLVEQNARLALSLAQRAYVMETGKVVLEGPAKDLSSDPNVQKSYLGLT